MFEYEATEYSVAICKKQQCMEIIILTIILKKFKKSNLPWVELRPDEQEEKEFVYRANIIGQKMILLDSYRSRTFPAIYPNFEMSDEGVL